MINNNRVGFWITEDGEVVAPDPSNLHRYVLNSPTNFTDPSGCGVEMRQEGKGFAIAPSMAALKDELKQRAAAAAENTGQPLASAEWQDVLRQLWSLGRGQLGGAESMNNRFLWTKKGGMIDLKHFFAAAYGVVRARTIIPGRLADVAGEIAQDIAIKKGIANEFEQFHTYCALTPLVRRDPPRLMGIPLVTSEMVPPPTPFQKKLHRELYESAFSFEDLPSNYFGTQFGKGLDLRETVDTLPDQLEKFINEELGGLLPPPKDDVVRQLNSLRNFSHEPILDPDADDLRSATFDGVTIRYKYPTSNGPGIGGPFYLPGIFCTHQTILETLAKNPPP